MQAAIPYLKIGAGVWAVTRTIRWGAARLIPQNPKEDSLSNDVKSVYDWFLNSQHEDVVKIRLGIATAYDFLPITIPIAYYQSYHAQYNFLEHIVGVDALFRISWIIAFSFARFIAEQQTYPNAATLARRVQHWLKPTGCKGCFND